MPCCFTPNAAPEKIPSAEAEATKDRAIGALLGLAIGDAVGTTLEFKPRDTYEPLTDMIGGGPFGLKPGQWTDDTAMALALTDSLMSKGDLDEQDILRHFVDWSDHGKRPQRVSRCVGTPPVRGDAGVGAVLTHEVCRKVREL